MSQNIMKTGTQRDDECTHLQVADIKPRGGLIGDKLDPLTSFPVEGRDGIGKTEAHCHGTPTPHPFV